VRFRQSNLTGLFITAYNVGKVEKPKNSAHRGLVYILPEIGTEMDAIVHSAIPPTGEIP